MAEVNGSPDDAQNASGRIGNRRPMAPRELAAGLFEGLEPAARWELVVRQFGEYHRAQKQLEETGRILAAQFELLLGPAGALAKASLLRAAKAGEPAFLVARWLELSAGLPTGTLSHRRKG